MVPRKLQTLQKNILWFIIVFMICITALRLSKDNNGAKGLHDAVGDKLTLPEVEQPSELVFPPKSMLPATTVDPFAAGPLKVLVLGYQRCGSSLLGYLFNKNPDAFFVFEPLDGAYQHLYATSGGWNVPSDIFQHRNGSHRELPKVEVNIVADTALGFLRCDTDLIPTETLTHHFLPQWLPRQIRMKRYTACISKHRAWSSNCQIKHLCPTRFGRSSQKSEACRDALEALRRNGAHSDIYQNSVRHTEQLSKKYKYREISEGFNNYTKCTDGMRTKAEYCFPVLNMECNESSIRSVKTVRMTMKSVLEVLKQDPDIKVLHLLRDPRAVAYSRTKHPSFRGISSKDMVYEAGLYCDQALRDVKLACELSQTFPRTFYRVIYEQLSRNLTQGAIGIYNFLKAPIPQQLGTWLQENTRNSEQYPSWASNMNYQTADEIAQICRPLDEALDKPWNL